MDLQALKNELSEVNVKIEKLDRQDSNSYTAGVAKSFHLGTVGGSGRNNYRLNKRRELDLEKTIERTGILIPLYKKRDALKNLIERVESGEYERDIQERESRKLKQIENALKFWNIIEAGKSYDFFGNGPVLVTKKNKKSIETGKDCKWTAAEIIGKEAAKLL